MAILSVFLLLFTACHIVSAISSQRIVDLLNDHIMGRQTGTTTPSQDNVIYDDVRELYLDQPLDHFANNDDNKSHLNRNHHDVHYVQHEGTLRQRYFYSDRYVALSKTREQEESSFAFLCVGGEGPSLDKSVLVDSVHCTGDMLELARILHEDHGASVHLFALEHRYYGLSFPVFSTTTTNSPDDASPSSNKHLIYLSSRQALADLANFVQLQNVKFPKAKWITFGGSYPGMLAAWARMLYPNLIHAGVSNSAPIQATLDFEGYHQRVGLDLRYARVGGSNECWQAIVQGHKEIVKALDNSENEMVAKMFNICNASSLAIDRNVDMFVGDGVIEIPAQGNDPSCTEGPCNLELLCAIVLDESSVSTTMDALATVARIQRQYDQTSTNGVGESCLTLDWNETLEFLSSPTRAKGIRSWLWQTCNEFGFYQTCKSNKCPYGRGYHTLDMDLEICEQAFGIKKYVVAQNVQDIREYYGGLTLNNATRILSVNGNVDPWSVLALLDSLDHKALPTHWVEGASHHFWTHPIKESDDADVKSARNVIYQQVMQWLNEEDAVLES